MKGTLRTALALALGVSMTMGTAMAANVSFTDVPSNHWAYSYVQKAAGEGLVTGIGGGLYGVDNKLSSADFGTMVCGMLYPEAASQYMGLSSYWWYPYMEAAYQKGIFAGTTAGDRRTADGRWTATVVEAGMSRYDLAQIIYNVSKSQDWEEPDDMQLLLTMAAIPDWSEIPANYQTAVLYSYAGGYLSGMDGKGTFNGKSTMTRGQASVVLCAMMDAKDEIDAPTYTNRPGKLVNGKDANEDNVMDALQELKYEFYEYDIWDLDRSYTSAKLGSATGGKAFAYMISDRVFGALPSETQDNADWLKPGDIVYLNDKDQYVVVTAVNGTNFDYVMCNGFGTITWRESGSIHDLDSKDKIYTRYEGERTYDLDEDKVIDLIDQFLDEEYDIDDVCDECEDGYESEAFYSKTVFGDRAFAYLLSDYIFDDRDVESYDGDELDIDEIRPGDVIELWDEDLYLVVYDVDTRDDVISYLYTNSSDKVRESELDFADLDQYDTIYTRYDGTVSSSDDTLSNGNDVTVRNVEDLIDDFLTEEYDEGDEWNDTYRSDVMSDGDKVEGSEAFAYYLSDYIFGDLAVTRSDIDDIAVGDVIWLDDKGDDDQWIYCVVTAVDDDYVDYVYAAYDDREETYYVDTHYKKISNMDSDADIVYTRYP